MKRVFTPITLAIVAPLLTLLVLTASVALPRYFVTPKYDFVYVVQDYSIQYQGSYDAIDGKITYVPNTYPDPVALAAPSIPPKLHRYSIKDDTISDITLEEANALKLNTNIKSKDGFTFQRSYSNYGMMFMSSGSSQDLYVLAGRGVSRKMSGVSLSHNGSAQFLAWIE